MFVVVIVVFVFVLFFEREKKRKIVLSFAGLYPKGTQYRLPMRVKGTRPLELPPATSQAIYQQELEVR